MSIVVGKIEEYDVLYIPEKDVLFCKNTTVSYDLLKAALIDRKFDRTQLKADLVLSVDSEIVTLGCLNTNLENCESIYQTIKKIKNGTRFSKKSD
jgi:hypothetical protein